MREWYELKFQLAFRMKVGAEFQEFFASIMERGYPSDFQKVKPYGREGDHKCDGYHQSELRVFQVYAPEQMHAASTIGKIETDFSGAINHWNAKMRSWVFVHNQWRGIPPQVLDKLLSINGRDGVVVSRWCEVELQNEFFRLSEGHQAAILGPAPTPQTLARIQMKDVLVVTNAIAQQDSLPSDDISEVPAGKLKANSLSESVQGLLKLGSRKANLVKSFFESWHDPQLGDRIARTFRSKYENLRFNAVVGDDAFFELWRFAGGGTQNSLAQEAAVLAVVAFLFEECEIFEAPANEVGS